MTTRISILPIELLDALSINPQDEKDAQVSSVSFLRLPHPRTGLINLCLPITTHASESSILELQNVAPNASRSWFNDGEVLSDGSMMLMTPIDPVLLLVPLLRVAFPQDGTLGNFRTVDDILENASLKLGNDVTLGESGLAPGDILELSELPCIREAMRRVCEVKDVAPDLVVFRYSHPKLLEYLVKKITRISNGDLVMKSRTLSRELAKDGLMDHGKEELLHSGRLKLACDLIAQYVSYDMHEELMGKFDFSALTKHLAALREADLVTDMTTTNGHIQKGQVDEGQNGINGKKRKSAVQDSAGVTKLRKANVKGMAKLSTFFKKK